MVMASFIPLIFQSGYCSTFLALSKSSEWFLVVVCSASSQLKLFCLITFSLLANESSGLGHIVRLGTMSSDLFRKQATTPHRVGSIILMMTIDVMIETVNLSA